MRHREIKWELSCELLPHWLAFISGKCYARSWGRKSLMVLLSSWLHMLGYQPDRQGIACFISSKTDLRVSNAILIRAEHCYVGGNTCPVLVESLGRSQAQGRGTCCCWFDECTCTTLPSESWCLCPQASAALCLGRRSLILPVGSSEHKDLWLVTELRARNCWVLIPKWTIWTTLFSAHGISQNGEQRDCESRGLRGTLWSDACCMWHGHGWHGHATDLQSPVHTEAVETWRRLEEVENGATRSGKGWGSGGHNTSYMCMKLIKLQHFNN